MGLASSQARLLQLTTRMHQIEYKTAKLEADKLQMANESKQVYEDYLDALEATKVQYKVLSTDGSVTYQNVNNYADFLAAGFAIDFRGTVYDGTDEYRSIDGKSIRIETATQAEVEAAGMIYDSYDKYYKVTQDGTTNFYKDGSDFSPAYGGSATLHGVEYFQTKLNYAQLCADAFGSNIDSPPENVSEVITNLINSGLVTIVQKRKDNIFAKETDIDFADFETSVATNTGLREEQDTTDLKKAEAKYEADMKRIDMKDRRYDQEIAAMEAERNAIKQEMETLKTVSKDNVERTFKLFG